MTKEDFKKKYHDKVIEIPYLPNMRSERELMGTINQVANCCAEMELKATLLSDTASFGMPKKLMVVTDPKHSFIDFVEMFFVPFWEEPREQRIMLNKIKEQAEDVEFEEIQG